jgi:hypothetical protein
VKVGIHEKNSLGVSESSNWVTLLSNTSVCTSISEEPSSQTNSNVDEDLDKNVLAIDNRGFADFVAIPDDVLVSIALL